MPWGGFTPTGRVFFLIYGTSALTAKKGYVYIYQPLADVLHSNLLPKAH
jgi:hypothetical protein